MIKGIGIDIVEYDRVQLKIANHILTKSELGIFNNHPNQLQFLASRFCLKEAIIKATNKKYGMREIEISNNEDGQPICNIDDLILSISHEKHCCVCMCIWEVL